MLDQKYITVKETPKRIEEPIADIYGLQGLLIDKTETMVRRCFTLAKADRINFDAFQAICFLIVADQHIDVNKGDLQVCLDLLGVHPVVLMDAVRVLKRTFRAPKNADLLTFIRYIGPTLLEKSESFEFE